MSEQRCDQCFNIIIDITKGVKYLDEQHKELTVCSEECWRLSHDNENEDDNVYDAKGRDLETYILWFRRTYDWCHRDDADTDHDDSD